MRYKILTSTLSGFEHTCIVRSENKYTFEDELAIWCKDHCGKKGLDWNRSYEYKCQIDNPYRIYGFLDPDHLFEFKLRFMDSLV